MSKSSSSDYVGKRQMKAVTARDKRHSSTMSGNFLGIFPEKPYSGVKKSKDKDKDKDKDKKKDSEQILENMTISIDLNVKDLPHSEGFIQMLSDNLGIVRVKKDFEVLSTTEKVIRAFAKAKFKNVATIKLDDDLLYDHPEKFYDADEAINTMMQDIQISKKKGKLINLKMLSKDHKDCEVEVKVSSYHMPWVHDILIKIEGTLPEEYFRRVINYLEDHLEIENMVDEWKKG